MAREKKPSKQNKIKKDTEGKILYSRELKKRMKDEKRMKDAKKVYEMLNDSWRNE